MLGDRVMIMMGMSGAMVPGGMRRLVVYMIKNRLIDCLVTTGANLFHDIHETPRAGCTFNVRPASTMCTCKST